MKTRIPACWLAIVAAVQGLGWAAAAGAETPQRQIAVGVYFSEDRHYCPDDAQSFADLKSQTGREAKLYMNFQTWTEEWSKFATRLAENALQHGGLFMVVWMPCRCEDGPGHSDPAWSCKVIASGRYDDYLRRYAADVKAFGKPVLMNLAHEMNGSWYPTGIAFDAPGVRHNGNTPEDFVAMWKHVWEIFHKAGAGNACWVWAPNIFYLNKNNSLPQQKADYQAMYPGDRYVDWIGLDGYCDGIKGGWKTFPQLFDGPYQAITRISSKPLMIAEFGCTEGGAPAGTSKADWIKRSYMVDIPSYPRIELVNWFSRDKSKQGEADWRFNSSKAALAAYAAAVNSPLYQGEIKLKQ